MINVEVTKNNNEKSLNLIKRFTRQMQSAGTLRRLRSERYYKREGSQNVNKKQKLKSLKKGSYVDKMIKLGKLPDKRRRR